MERLDTNTTDALEKLLSKSERSYCVRFAADMVVYTVWDDVAASMSIDLVTRVPTGPRGPQSSAAAGDEVYPKATTTEAIICVGAKVQDS